MKGMQKEVKRMSRLQPRPQGLLLDDFQNGHFENRRGEGPGDEVAAGSFALLPFAYPSCKQP